MPNLLVNSVITRVFHLCMFMNPSGHCHGHSRGPQPFQGDNDLQPIQGGSLRTTYACAKLLHGWLHVAGKTLCVILFMTFIKPYIFCPHSSTCKHLHKSSLDFSIGFEYFEAFTFLRPKVMKDCSWPVSFLTSGKIITSN